MLCICRYSFLAFSYDEEVKPNRDTCRILLMRLKMDGWALGKSKVFLKYYHVEVLARIYEEQVNGFCTYGLFTTPLIFYQGGMAYQ